MILASAYISREASPILKCPMDGDGFFVEFSFSRLIHRLVAAEKSCGPPNGRLDTVFVLVRREHDRSHADIKKMYRCWFGKVLRFFSVRKTSGSKVQSQALRKPYYKKKITELYQELLFVQWYKVLNPNELCIDSIDRDITCVWLRWEWNPEKPEIFLVSEEHRLTHLESIRSMVKVVLN